MTFASITRDELDVLEYATAWHHGNRRLLRNHWAPDDGDPVARSLASRGLIAESPHLRGVYAVTDAGIAALREVCP